MAKRDTARENRFARLVAVDGLSYLAAFCESADGYPKPEPTPAARVQASRYAARTSDLRAKLAKEKADASAPTTVATDAQSILRLMDEVSGTLLHISKVAKAHGHDRLANQLRKALTTHTGRYTRISQRIDNPGASSAVDESGVETFAKRILEAEA